MSTQANKAVVEGIYAALAAGDRSAFAAACHPDYSWRLAGQSSWSRTFVGHAAIGRDLIAPLFALFADRYTARVTNLVAEGDQVVAEVRGDVTTKSGARYDNQYCIVFRFRDGLVAEIVEYCDTDLIERVLGDYDAAVAAYTAG